MCELRPVSESARLMLEAGLRAEAQSPWRKTKKGTIRTEERKKEGLCMLGLQYRFVPGNRPGRSGGEGECDVGGSAKFRKFFVRRAGSNCGSRWEGGGVANQSMETARSCLADKDETHVIQVRARRLPWLEGEF